MSELNVAVEHTLTRGEVLAGRAAGERPNAICRCGAKYRRTRREHRYCSHQCAVEDQRQEN